MKLVKKDVTDTSDVWSLAETEKQGRQLESARLDIERQLNESYNRIAHPEIGFEAQLKKVRFEWNKLSQNQQSLSNLMKQLKNVQSIWKLQLKINLQINKLSKVHGFNGGSNKQRRHASKQSSPLQLCVKIIKNIQNMIEQSDRAVVQITLENKSKRSLQKSSLNDIVHQLPREMKLYSNILIKIIQFAFESVVKISNLSIAIKSEKELKSILQCIDKMDIAPCISFIHCSLMKSIFDALFDPTSSLSEIEINSKPKSLEISRIFAADKIGQNANDNLLCSNVDSFLSIIQWIELNIFLNDDTFCKHWRERHLSPLIDEWIIVWINLNTPILSSLLCVPKFKNKNEEKTNDSDADQKFDEIQQSAIQHINRSIAYQQNIVNAMQTLQTMMGNEMSAKYLQKSLKLIINDDDENEYGLSSKILSSILPSKIREFIFESIRTNIKNHGYQSFNPLHLQLFKQKVSKNKDNKMISYFALITSSESFFRTHQCEISQTMFELVIILYNICIFIEQMYYIDDDSKEDIVCLATMYVDLFMDICRHIIQLWMSLSTSYHKQYFNKVASLGFQFYNDCSFLSYHLCQLSIATNHGNLLITDKIRSLMESKNIVKYMWFTDYIQPLKSLGKKYFIFHLHNQRQTILKCLKIINKFHAVDKLHIYENIKTAFDESLVSISQFLNGCRSIIPDKNLYTIGGKLLQCVCDKVVDEVMCRIDSIKMSDISVTAAHNISRIITHVSEFEILSNDLEYMTRNISVWDKFIKLGDILHEEQSLAQLTKELNSGALDCFDSVTLSKLICALFQESEKRNKFIQGVELMLD